MLRRATLRAACVCLILGLLTLGLSACGQRPPGVAPSATPASAAAASAAAVPAPAQPTAASGDLLQRIHERGRIRIGVKADSPPFGVEHHGVRSGFDIDIALLLARRLGVEPEFVTVTSADRIPRLLAGELDLVIASMTQTRGRERQVDFSIPYFEDGPAILARAGAGIQHYTQFGERRLGVARGSSTAASIGKFVPEARIVELPAIRDLLPALDRGEVDAVASDYLILLALAKQSGRAQAYEIIGGRIVAEPYGIALPPNQSALRDAVNEALMAMWDSGEWAQVAALWFGPGGALPADLRFQMPTIPP